MLRDPRIRKKLTDYRLIFAYVTEWPKVRRNHVRAGWDGEGLEREMARLQAAAGGARVVHPDRLQDLPGEVYFIPADTELVNDRGTPGVLSHWNLKFDTHPIDWMAWTGRVSADFVRTVWEEKAAE